MFSPARASAVFSTLSLSPVSELSFTFSEKFSKMRPVCSYEVARLQQQDIARYKLCHGQFRALATAQHFGAGEAMAFRLARLFQP